MERYLKTFLKIKLFFTFIFISHTKITLFNYLFHTFHFEVIFLNFNCFQKGTTVTNFKKENL